MEDPIRILLVEDHQMVRQGLVALLSATDDLEVVGAVGDGEEAVKVYRELLPDVTLVDLQMPKLGGVETIKRVRHADPVTGYEDAVALSLERIEALTELKTAWHPVGA